MHKKRLGLLLLLALALTLLFGLTMGTAYAGEPPYDTWDGGSPSCPHTKTHPESAMNVNNEAYHARLIMCDDCYAQKWIKEKHDLKSTPSTGHPGYVIKECSGCSFMKEYEDSGSSSSSSCVHPNPQWLSMGQASHVWYCPDCQKFGMQSNHILTTTEAIEGHYRVITDSCSLCNFNERREYCLHDGGTTMVNDGLLGHHEECNICHENIYGVSLAHETEQGKAFFRTPADYGCYEACTKCSYSAWVTLPLPKDLNKAEVGEIPDQEFTGKPLTPDESVTLDGEKLVKGKDYTVEYEKNDGPGTGVLVIKPLDGVSIGERRKEFKITCAHPNGLLKYESKSDSAHSVYCTNCKTDLGLEDHAYTQITVTKEATCTENAVLERKCVCGKVDTENTAPKEGENADWFAHHIWGDTYESDFWQHWTFCTRCSAPSEKQAHELTNVKVLVKNDCIQNGSIEADCSVCGRKGLVFSAGIESEAAMFPVLQQYKALGHDFSGPLKYNKSSCTSEGEGNHAPSCIRCGIRDSENAAPHTWGGWDYVSQGSCKEPKEDVVRTATCECGAKLTLTYPREHVWVDDKSQDVQATCTESGKINGQRCTICGIFGNYDFVPALGHNIEVIDKLDATCLTEGYKHIKCSNPGCDIDETEIIPTLGGDGKHHFKPVASQEPTCTTDGQYNGEKCENCPAEQAGETGYGIIPALGHKVVSSTASHGKTRTAVGKDGRPIEMQVYVTTFSCKRCGASLGGETFTVATSVGKLGGQYLIESGNVTITDMENGIHIDGNMKNDGGVRFNDEVQKGFEEVIKTAGTKYTYKKVETKSFVIEFTDEFLAEIEDGEYKLEVINGDEYWPMMVTVKDHKFKALRDVDAPDMPELTEDEFNALLAELGADGGIVSRFMLVQPGIEAAASENGDIVVTKKDGDYDFGAIVCGEYTLVADQDYTLDGDTITLKAEYLNGLTGEQEITFQYAPFDMEGAPAPHNPKLTVGK